MGSDNLGIRKDLSCGSAMGGAGHPPIVRGIGGGGRGWGGVVSVRTNRKVEALPAGRRTPPRAFGAQGDPSEPEKTTKVIAVWLLFECAHDAFYLAA